ncbi:ion transporter [uncultured Aquimarina sp.]|uniref:ion transporter n=1 Tax=uncultured Aquimarina sp. TaxID=575652 RepID=UPI00262CFDAD|nr:ion transporter [uncultured Aquimarina sp.]
MKQKLYHIIYQNENFTKFIYSVIILNVICLILESYKFLYVNYHRVFMIIEYISIIIFTIEYVARIWVSNLDKRKDNQNYSNRIQYIFSGYGIIDIVSILPFYLPLFIPFDLRVIRILRLFRLVRILKIGRYSKSIKTIGIIIKEARPELTITLFVAFILLTLSSTLIFYVENQAQPDKFSNIGEAFWWSVATLTTVGYGDVYPVTSLGKFLSAIIALTGIGFIALPTGIISSAFIEKVKRDKEEKLCTCPSCGEAFNVE